jgi:hypothetical protein
MRNAKNVREAWRKRQAVIAAGSRRKANLSVFPLAYPPQSRNKAAVSAGASIAWTLD